MLKRIDRYVLLHYFDALKCGVRQSEFARKLLERLIAPLLFEKFGQLFSELIAHADRVQPPVSHIWEINVYIAFAIADNFLGQAISQQRCEMNIVAAR